MLIIGDFGKIEINVLSRSTSNDYWDGNWLACLIEINIGFFAAQYNCNLRTDEFSMFVEKLEELMVGKHSEAQFSSMEDGFLLNITKDLLGGFVLKGEAICNDNYKTKLLYEVCADYMQMEQLKISIYNLLKRYPVVGVRLS